MNPPSLLSLPAEVRLNIYSHLFDDESLPLESSAASKTPQLAPLLRTCRHLRDEAGPSYFRNVHVQFHVQGGGGGGVVPATSLIQWMESIGESNVRLLTNFTMRWEGYVDIQLELKRNVRRGGGGGGGGEGPVTEEEEKLDNTECLSKATPRMMLNPTTSIRCGQKHILTMRGIEGSEEEEDNTTTTATFWKRHGTAEFCDALTKHLSPRIAATLETRAGAYMTARELVEFVDDASRHAGGLRWLWYW